MGALAMTVIAAHMAWGRVPRVTFQSPDFIFPTKLLLDNNIYPTLAKATGSDLDTVRAAYSPLFSILAFRFGPSGSISVMTAEVRMVVTRVTGQMAQNLTPAVEERDVVTEGLKV